MWFEPVDRDGVRLVAELEGEELGRPGQDAVWAAVLRRQRRRRAVDPDVHQVSLLQGGGRLQGWRRSRWARGDDRHVPQLLVELLEVWFGGGDELPRQGEGDAKKDLCGRDAGVLLRRSTQS